MSNFEVLTMVDKSKRDEIYRQLRESDDLLERQVVKFSGNQPMLDESGLPVVLVYSNSRSKAKAKRFQVRPQFISNWSVAYPRN